MIALAIPDDDRDLVAFYRAKFQDLTVEQLYDSLRKSLRMTAESWLDTAFAIQALEDRGEDMDKIRGVLSGGYLAWLRRVAAGDLRPELICRYWQSSELVNRLGRLPSPDQLKLANGGRVAAVVTGPDGKTTTRNLSVEEIRDGGLMNQVFATDRIRTESEQAAYLDALRREAAKPKPEHFGPLSVDRERGVAVIRGKRGDVIDRSTLHAVVAALRN